MVEHEHSQDSSNIDTGDRPTGQHIHQAINDIYEKSVCWWRNLFKLPSEKFGENFGEKFGEKFVSEFGTSMQPITRTLL